MHRLRQLALFLFIVPLYGACSLTYLGYTRQVVDRGWTTPSQAPAGPAPNPATTHEAIIQVYAARVAEWHGYFGVHSWIAVKPTDAREYRVYEVTRAALDAYGSAVIAQTRAADADWYGNRPELLREVRGTGVDALIARIDSVAHRYPFASLYRVWPGPNSNTFVAHIGREVPELRIDLPATAVGKDFLGALPFATTPSGTGGQFNLYGAAGIAVGWEDGFELNLFGLTFGVDPNDFALKLPMLGRVGPTVDNKSITINTEPR